MLCPAAGPCHPGPANPKPTEYHVYHYHLAVNSPELTRNGGLLIFSPVREFGVSPQDV